MTGIHFAHPSNRFYSALCRPCIVDRLIDVSPSASAVPVPFDPRGAQPSPTAALRMLSAHPGNRFHAALPVVGNIERSMERFSLMSDDDRRHIVERGIGITNLVSRATARADELSIEELRLGAERLEATVARHRPKVVTIAGVTAFRTALRRPKAALGERPATVAGARLWVVPNPSGLNAHDTIDTLAARYREAAATAGVVTA